MALTTQQEQQVKDLLVYFSQIIDLGAKATEIDSALGYGDVRVIDLPVASPLAANDVMYLAQTNTDVKASVQQLGQFVFANFDKTYIDQALAQFNDQINTSLDYPRAYFVGQF